MHETQVQLWRTLAVLIAVLGPSPRAWAWSVNLEWITLGPHVPLKRGQDDLAFAGLIMTRSNDNPADPDTQVIKLTLTETGAGRIKVWNCNRTEVLVSHENKVKTWPASQVPWCEPMHLWVEGTVTSSTPEDLTLTLTWENTDAAPKTVKATVLCVEVLHPVTSDFADGKGGRLLISAKHAGGYHTATKTTRADEVAQTSAAAVTVTAYVVPKMADVRVYFRVEDPDPDDPSPYEGNPTGGDNEDEVVPPLNKAGSLSAADDTTEIVTIAGVERAAAEVVLSITNRNAGDNYKVAASTSAGLGAKEETALLTAWKRVYIEYDRMLRSDKTTECAEKQQGYDIVASGKLIYAKNASGINADDWVHVFDNGSAATSAGEVRQVESVDTDAGPDEIHLKTALDHSYRKSNKAHVGPVVYAGGQVNEQASYFCVDIGLVAQAFGAGYVEVTLPANNGNGPVPWKPYTGSPVSICLAFSQEWFLNKQSRFDDNWTPNPPDRSEVDTGKENYFHMVGACKLAATMPVCGRSRWTHNFLFLFVKEIEEVYGDAADNALREITVHELGHQFQVCAANPQAHCSNNAYTPPSDGEKCIMHHDTEMDNNEARFCVEHLADGMTSQESIRDIGDDR